MVPLLYIFSSVIWLWFATKKKQSSLNFTASTKNLKQAALNENKYLLSVIRLVAWMLR